MSILKPKVSYAIKKMFFDRLSVINRLDKAKHKMLGQCGAFIRRNAQRTQLRRRIRTSAAGSPPSVHSRDKITNLRNILFAFDGRDSLLVGPVGLNGSRGAIPGLHEHGGSRRIREVRIGLQWVPEGKMIKRGRRKYFAYAKTGQPVRWRNAQYPSRPFMFPALREVAPQFPALFGRAM